MENTNLFSYINERLREGASKSEIQERLTSVGWEEEDVNMAYAQALREFGVPAPENVEGGRKKPSSTLEIILNFFSFILLGIVVSALSVLYFEVIDKYFPDSVIRGGYGSYVSSDAVHYSIAALIIGFPLYFFAIRMWFRKFREDEVRVESRLTKWITYLVLLAASVTIVGDLIVILFEFLQGEMSIRFFLKAVTILVIAGLIFGFYFLERKKVQYRHNISRRVFQLFGWNLLVIVLVGIIFGFMAVGSPKTERLRTFDEKRSNDLVALSDCINRYAREFKRLPRTLSSLEQSSTSSGYRVCSNMRDPETQVAYEYTVVSPSQTVDMNREGEYQLCATFSLSSDEDISTTKNRRYYSGYVDSKWHIHGIGRQCDTVRVVLENITTINTQ